MNAPLNFQLLRLSALLQLEQRARRSSERELEFLIVNETTTLVNYQQAVLWRDDHDRSRLTLSGVAVIDESSPYRVWLDRLITVLKRGPSPTECRSVTAQDLPDELGADWSEWLPPNAVWCPLTWRGTVIAGFLAARAEPWQPGDIQLLEALTEAYAQSLVLVSLGDKLRSPRRWFTRRRPQFFIALAAILLLAILPVRESVLAPAEIVPVNPAPVRAPFDGVVDKIDVVPNQSVHAGQVLISFDRTQLYTRYAVAEKALDMAQEEYTSASQAAMTDPKANAQVAMLASKVDQQRAEVTYDKDMLDRADLTAPTDGIAVFDDVDAWIGKPVVLGERIMMVASPSDTQLEIQVPASEAVTFERGAKVLFFNNIEPDHPTAGHLDFVSYSSAVTAEGVLAYAFRAKFDQASAEGLRLGLKGTAKIYGPRRMLALWLFRRPIALAREWLSL